MSRFTTVFMSLLFTSCIQSSSLALVDADTEVRLGRGETVDVFVTLKMPVESSALEIEQRRQEVLACAGWPEVARSWERVPLFRADLSPRQVRGLRGCPGVESITHPPDVEASTVDAVPLVGVVPDVGIDGLTGAGQTVVVLDGGLDVTAPQFGNCTAPGIGSECRIAFGYDFVRDTFDVGSCGSIFGDHGTYMTSVLHTVAPEADVIFMKVDDDDCLGPGFSGDGILEALAWVADHGDRFGVSAINMSFSSNPWDGICDEDIDPAFRVVMDRLAADGVLMIAAAGNSGDPDRVAWPACHSGATAVAGTWDGAGDSCPVSTATGGAREVAPYSNGGALVEVAAPGSVISAAGFEDCGTSAAAAIVTGAVALLGESAPAARGAQIRDALTVSSTVTADARGSVPHAYPFLDVPSALAALEPEVQLGLDATAMARRQRATVVVTEAVAGTPVSFWAGVQQGPSSCPPMTDPDCLDIESAVWLGEAVADPTGRATLSFVVPRGVPDDVLLQASQTVQGATVSSPLVARSVL